jgi:integrase
MAKAKKPTRQLALHARFPSLMQAPLGPMIDSFARYMSAKPVGPRYIYQTVTQACRLLELAGVQKLSEVTPSRVQPALATIRLTRKSKTANEHLVSLRAFVSLMIDEGHIPVDPIRRVGQYRVDDATKRRALSQTEAQKMISAAEVSRRTISGWTGAERAMLYRLALSTGFRRSELLSIEPHMISFLTTPPFITLPPDKTKNRKGAKQVIPDELAATLAEFTKRKARFKPIFDSYATIKLSRMVRMDAKAAGIVLDTAEGRIDCHALRHTYVTWLVRSGVDIGTVRTMARHHSAAFTLQRYSHTSDVAAAEAVSALPVFETPAELAVSTSNSYRMVKNQKKQEEDKQQNKPSEELARSMDDQELLRAMRVLRAELARRGNDAPQPPHTGNQKHEHGDFHNERRNEQGNNQELETGG